MKSITEKFLSSKKEKDEIVKIALISDESYWMNFCKEVCHDCDNCQIYELKNIMTLENKNSE